MNPTPYLTRRARNLPLSTLNRRRRRRAPFARVRALLILLTALWSSVAALVYVLTR